ncbi:MULTISPECIES: isoprenylcysteine carboxylmethyltransferase family protein [Alphaproteobacteria]|uniref:methyltransferase family protein n=1 Tax=Alphaproteobacteria TaxID=28211 RepID=UPI0019D3CEA3|nr:MULTISPECIES: isoprenylcysteine carboxylmethyltransferase family protein [Alphaproteobacteria]MBY6021407.1 isoprenylcysteine carboxylmethyltransferase family protein [Nitratireductor sp. DP7N14-4]MBN7756621.1 isoprenylcysteine carboxylmethyltransferase family protein [Nitratireductor aquimarinus]MBN7760229.1 isoprenylcysteine carboxylmethyltransferase family protein [Nitratireductor aquibiodomus]MBN7777031.1 isoprenylcysteine carboxylmethyltransferase family protein [Nitratireductor pacificu
MNDHEQRPARFPWPPVIYLSAIVIAAVLGIFYPLPWIGPPLSDLLFAIGWLLIAGFVFIDLQAMRTLHRAGTAILPTRGADTLVTSGPFSFSRNPIYLGNSMLTAGIGLVAGNAWFFASLIVACFLTQKLAIEPEEKHLGLRFGKKYRDYQKRVRRWF